MPNNKPTYQDLLIKIDQLKSENKQLRLRPAVHSTDARLLDFMKIKSQLSNAMLNVTDLRQAIRISVQYLSKIDNIHGLGFFKFNNHDSSFEIVQEHKLPKKFINPIKGFEFLPKFVYDLFPEKNQFYSNFAGHEKENPEFLEYLKSFVSVLIMPIIEHNHVRYSLLLISKKEFQNSRLFKIVYENIQTQLRNSYTRLINSDEASVLKYSENENTKQQEGDNNLEKINKELLRQLKVYREQNLKITEELDLYKSIINQQKDIILRINREGQLLYYNPAFDKISAYIEDDSNQLTNYLGEGDFPGLSQILHDFEEGIQQVNCEIQLLSDLPKWFNFFFSPIKNKRGLIVEIQIVARNIDKIVRLEHELELQREMLLNMLNKSDYLGFAIDQDGYINMITNNLEKSFGFNNKYFMDHSIIELVDYKGKKEIEQFLSSGSTSESLKIQISFNLPNLIDRYFDLELNSIECLSANKKYYIGNLSFRKENRSTKNN